MASSSQVRSRADRKTHILSIPSSSSGLEGGPKAARRHLRLLTALSCVSVALPVARLAAQPGMSSWIQGMRRWRTVRSNSIGRMRAADRPPPTPASPPTSGLENFPEPAKLVTETAGVKAELRQQIGVLAITGIHLIRELLAGLLSLVVITLALQQLHNLVFAEVHEPSFPSNW
jgi:hypothetical protein